MDRLRLIITFKSGNVVLPVRYKHLIQGWIYSIFEKEDYGKFLHDEGYPADGKKFKMFVFSDLMGTFQVQNQLILYQGPIRLEIASLSEKFISGLFTALQNSPQIILDNQILHVDSMALQSLPYFPGEKEFLLRTISPVTAYRTIDRRFEYYAPDSHDFQAITLQNLQRKNEALFHEKDLAFTILGVSRQQKKIVYFKNTFYIAYRTVLKVKVDYRAMEILMNTGLSSKGSAGFGMMEILHE